MTALVVTAGWLWTLLIIVLILAIVFFVFGRGRW